MSIELTFEQLEDGIRRGVASGDDRVGFNRYFMERAVIEIDRLRAQRDPAICRLQFPDGSVPGDLEECAAGWKRRYDEVRAERDEARQGYHALDRNWETLKNAVTRSIADALGIADDSRPAIIAAIESKGERIAALEAALRSFAAIAAEAHKEWDADNDHRVGKILRALSGDMPKYRADIDAIHAALKGGG